jgi:hypothetical protein
MTLGFGSPAFAAASPAVSVTPAAALDDGQTVSVSATGFPAGETLYVVECSATGPACHGTEFRSATVAEDGTATVSLPAAKTFTAVTQTGEPVSIDCAVDPCGFAAFTTTGSAKGEAAISFR